MPGAEAQCMSELSLIAPDLQQATGQHEGLASNVLAVAVILSPSRPIPAELWVVAEAECSK